VCRDVFAKPKSFLNRARDPSGLPGLISVPRTILGEKRPVPSSILSERNRMLKDAMHRNEWHPRRFLDLDLARD